MPYKEYSYYCLLLNSFAYRTAVPRIALSKAPMTNGTKPTRTAFSTPMEAESQSAPKSDNKNIGGVLADEGSKKHVCLSSLFQQAKPLMAAAIGKETK